MSHALLRPALVALACSALALTALSPATAKDGSGQPPGTFVGIDGVQYSTAPQVVTTRSGQEFLGSDFDAACHGVVGLEKHLHALAKLARVIRRSGRHVVFTVPPSKTLVVKAGSRPGAYPHGSCDQVGLAQEVAKLDAFDDPAYLPVRSALARHGARNYWRTDPHWNTLGGSVYARELARRLDPRLADMQRYAHSTETATGLFSVWLDDPVPETTAAAEPAWGVSSRPAAGSVDYTGFPDLVFDHSWVSSPARRTWPGRTLLTGDSYTLWALGSLRPIFHKGRYLWTDKVPQDTLVDAIKDADTVVFEVVSFNLPSTPLAQSGLRHAVARALRTSHR